MSNQPPKVSVVVPAYNNADFIRQALASVDNQNYPNIEIIVVDDGSTDNTRRLVADYRDGHRDDIKLLCQTNAGPAAARNTGLRNATGRYVAMLDADDWFAPHKLHKQVAILESAPRLGAVHSGWDLVDAEGRPIKTIEPWRDAPKLDLRSWLIWKPVRLGAMLFRREWVQRVGYFDPDLRQAEDTDLMFRLALEGCSFAWLRESTLCYRHHDASTVRSRALEQSECNLRVLDKLYRDRRVPKSATRRERFVRYYTNIWTAWHLFQCGHAEDSVFYLRQSIRYAPHPVAQVVHDWLALYIQWCADDGADFRSLATTWPQLRTASGMDANAWDALERQLDWYLDVWCHYASGDFDRGRRQLALHLSPEDELVRSASTSLLLSPGKMNVDSVSRFWCDAVELGAVDPRAKHRVTELYLMLSGRSVWHWDVKLAALSLRHAVGNGYRPVAWPAWWRFAGRSMQYLRGRFRHVMFQRRCQRDRSAAELKTV